MTTNRTIGRLRVALIFVAGCTLGYFGRGFTPKAYWGIGGPDAIYAVTLEGEPISFFELLDFIGYSDGEFRDHYTAYADQWAGSVGSTHGIQAGIAAYLVLSAVAETDYDKGFFLNCAAGLFLREGHSVEAQSCYDRAKVLRRK
ncbi:MAG: hypothetical protein ACJAZ8_002054 [Planctomycetota bacterium]|jgi:hypothetical protein